MPSTGEKEKKKKRRRERGEWKMKKDKLSTNGTESQIRGFRTGKRKVQRRDSLKRKTRGGYLIWDGRRDSRRGDMGGHQGHERRSQHLRGTSHPGIGDSGRTRECNKEDDPSAVAKRAFSGTIAAGMEKRSRYTEESRRTVSKNKEKTIIKVVNSNKKTAREEKKTAGCRQAEKDLKKGGWGREPSAMASPGAGQTGSLAKAGRRSSFPAGRSRVKGSSAFDSRKRNLA